MGINKYQNVRIGMTGRLDTMQAVVLDAKLDIFAEELALRQQVADRYRDKIGNIVETPSLAVGASSSWAQYTIKLLDGVDRDAVSSRYAGSRCANRHLLPCADALPTALQSFSGCWWYAADHQ